MLLGHIAVPFIIRHYFNADLAPVTAGTIFPDFFDKSLQQIGLVKSGRSIAHTLLALAATTLLLKSRYDRATARDWLLGYVGHMICDLGGLVPWWYPFAAYDFKSSNNNIWQKIKAGIGNTNLIELLLLSWAAKLLFSKAK